MENWELMKLSVAFCVAVLVGLLAGGCGFDVRGGSSRYWELEQSRSPSQIRTVDWKNHGEDHGS